MTETDGQHRYKEAEGKHWIETRIRSPLQLFDARDPAPFRERDLDDDFVEWITSSAFEISSHHPIKIVIYIEESEPKDLTKTAIVDAIRGHLIYRISSQTRELRAFLKRAQVFLFLGLCVLGTLLGIAQSLRVPNPPGWIGILREGLVIFAWVSIWKPVELIFFDWYPLIEKRRLYRRLLGSEIDIRFSRS